MGCNSSKSESSSVELDTKDLMDPALKDDMVPNTAANIKGSNYKGRLVRSEGATGYTFPKSQCKLQFAYVSQRGLYPDAPGKPNQDAFICQTGFANNAEQALFGVFDGHGEYGTECATYARDMLPVNFKNDPNFQNAPEVACHHACVLTNVQLRASKIDDSMSGTTAILALIRGTSVTVINIGDSRAVLAEMQGTDLMARDLSWDQTPMRPDECERVKAQGARVLTLDQLDGLKDHNIQSWTEQDEDEGDAPRLWAPNGKYPGTAFTRSIGDATAEAIGVFSEPEVLVKRLTAQNPFLIVASDGVWEFLSSQSVVEMVSKYDDPQEAALAIAAESYRLWLQHESRTDDITIIIVQLMGIEDAAPTMAAPTPYGSPMDYSSKNTSRKQVLFYSKKVKPVEAMDDVCPLESELPPLLLESPNSKMVLIGKALQRLFNSHSLSPEQHASCVQQMTKRTYQAGDIVAEQGASGVGFFIMESGQFDVLVCKKDNKLVLVHTYTVQGDILSSFGELSLLYGKPQAASIVARSEGAVWLLSREMFKAVMANQQQSSGVEQLRKLKFLRTLTWGQLDRLVSNMLFAVYAHDDVLLQSSEPSFVFGLILGGQVRHTMEGGGPGKVLGVGGCIGEEYLYRTPRRGCSMVADGTVRLLQVELSKFEELIGPPNTLKALADAWSGRMTVQKQMVLHQRIASVVQNLDYADMETRGTLYVTDTSMLILMEHMPSSNIYTIHSVEIREVVALGRQKLAMRRRDITRALEPSLFVPHVGQTFKTGSIIAELLVTNGLCTIEHLMAQGAFDERLAQFVTACVVIGLEQLHRGGIAYRGLSTETLVVSEQGYIQLTDLRFSKLLKNRTFTLCGHPEYMAPEMIDCTGHTDAVDMWALGVLIYTMLTKSTPFAAQGDNEMAIYRKIVSVNVMYPKQFSPVLCDLLQSLLQRNPANRLGMGARGVQSIKEHPWFSDMDWEALSCHDLQPPLSIRERIYNFEGLSIVPMSGVPVQRSYQWVKQF